MKVDADPTARSVGSIRSRRADKYAVTWSRKMGSTLALDTSSSRTRSSSVAAQDDDDTLLSYDMRASGEGRLSSSPIPSIAEPSTAPAEAAGTHEHAHTHAHVTVHEAPSPSALSRVFSLKGSIQVSTEAMY
jgi:hypothetical protein